MPEDGITFVGVRPNDVPAALFFLVLQGVDVSPEAVEFPLQGGEVIDGVKVMAELSSDSPVPHVKGPGDDCVVARWVGDGIEEPLGILPILVNGVALGGEKLLAIDGFVL